MSKLHRGESLSPWIDTKSMPQFSKLTEDVEVDVVIVGGGIAGLTTAYLLMKEGKRVCVLESFELASGQTGKTTAHFSTSLGHRYFELENYHGERGAQLAAESHLEAIEKVQEIIRDEQIDCELEILDGYLFAQGDTRPGVLHRELEACHRAGLKDVELLESSPLHMFNMGPCLRFTDQMQLHPLKYLSTLSKRIVEGGGQIFTHTHVEHVHGGRVAVVTTKDGFTVKGQSVVVATNSPINDMFALHTKQAPYRTYAIGLKIPKVSMVKALYWDTLDPYHYIRIDSTPEDYDVLIVGGQDHKTGQEDHLEPVFGRLIEWAKKRFPVAKDVLYRWSGQVMEPVDGLAYLGHNPMDSKNVYVITGDAGNGMTHTTIGAMLITDQIMNRENEWEYLYSPSRISLSATSEFMKENLNVAAQYGEWFTKRPKPDFGTLAEGAGVVFRDGLKMVAVYKGEEGNLEFMSASCPHLAAVVHWNSIEKSWDCPCHGSRFDCHGKVIEGPAFTDLKKLNKQLDRAAVQVALPNKTSPADTGNLAQL